MDARHACEGGRRMQWNSEQLRDVAVKLYLWLLTESKKTPAIRLVIKHYKIIKGKITLAPVCPCMSIRVTPETPSVCIPWHPRSMRRRDCREKKKHHSCPRTIQRFLHLLAFLLSTCLSPPASSPPRPRFLMLPPASRPPPSHRSSPARPL